MIYVNYLIIVVAAIASFLFSTLYYVILRNQIVVSHAVHANKRLTARPAMSANKVVVELVRTFITVLVIAYAIGLLNLLYVNQAILLAFWLWLGLPVMLLAGLVAQEQCSPRLAVIHAGDWLAKLLILSVVLTVWK